MVYRSSWLTTIKTDQLESQTKLPLTTKQNAETRYLHKSANVSRWGGTDHQQPKGLCLSAFVGEKTEGTLYLSHGRSGGSQSRYWAWRWANVLTAACHCGGFCPWGCKLVQGDQKKLSSLTTVNSKNSPQLPSRRMPHNKGETTGNGAQTEQNRNKRVKEKEGSNESERRETESGTHKMQAPYF